MSEVARLTNTGKLTERQIAIGIGALGFCVIVTAGLFMSWSNGWLSPVFLSDPSPSDDLTLLTTPLPVNVARVEFVDSIQQTRRYTGTIRARQRSDLGFELAGKIEMVDVDEGDVVEKGQILAQLNLETLNAQESVILARIAQAKSVMAELNAGPRVETIRAVRAEVEKASSIYDNATSNFKRRTNLWEAGAISSEEYDQARLAQKTALAILKAAQERLSELVAGTRHEKKTAQKSMIDQLDASRREIDAAISKSFLVAPFSGTVTRRYLDPGSIAQPSAPIIRLVQRQHLEAWIGLPVSIAADVEIGTEYGILVGHDQFDATASAKIQELDPATRTQTVVFELDSNAASKVVSGQLCEIQFTSTVNTSGYWIPTTAATRGIRGLWSVMIISPDPSGTGFRTEKRDIEIIKTGSGHVLVQGTIAAGDRIIADGLHRIVEGQWVVPSNEQDSPIPPRE